MNILQINLPFFKREENEKICVAELESEINLTLADDKAKRR